MPDAAYLEFRLSGGASQTDPNASLGGIMSSETIKSQGQTGLGIAGITFIDGFSNPENVGTLQLRAGPTLRWVPAGDAFLNEAGVATDGRYSLHSVGGSAILLDVITASLPAPDVDDVLTMANIRNELFDNISSTEAWQGSVDYRCIFITNVHPSITFNTVKIWVEQQPLGEDTLRLGYNSAKKNLDAEVIGSETTAPTGSVVFGTHESEGTAIDLSPLAATDRWPIWIERTIGAETLNGSSRNVFKLRLLGLD
jgi:hypothetical protein